MLKTLVKKQLTEVFRGYFYDAKKNKKRSKSSIIMMFIFFLVIMLGVLGGSFTYLSLSMCGIMSEANMAWLYFAIMSLIAILLGVFGSVFNTYNGLYLSKDNDLLLSMPISIRDIIASRIINVYIMGCMYSLLAIVPAVVVYWIITGVTFKKVLCGIVLVVIVTMIVLMLSCLLGWCVAKISMKLKNKSYVTVIVSLLFMGAYYFFYFKAQTLLEELIENVVVYGKVIKDAAYPLYAFGTMGEGNILSTAVFTLITVILLVLTYFILKKSFVSIATNAGISEKVKYKEEKTKQKSVFSALLSKEFRRFTSNANYMLNCGLGIIMIPFIGVLALINGQTIFGVLYSVFENNGSLIVIMCSSLFAAIVLNDIAAPSVSLEGKSIWIPQSLPVSSALILKAKSTMHLILTAIPTTFAMICCLVVLKMDLQTSLLTALLIISYTLFSTMFASFLGIKLANTTWTSEIVPVKQSGAATITIFGGYGIIAIFAMIYFLLAYEMNILYYLLIWIAVFVITAAVLYRWMITRGAKLFAQL